jgi:hypothetical protein
MLVRCRDDHFTHVQVLVHWIALSVDR